MMTVMMTKSAIEEFVSIFQRGRVMSLEERFVLKDICVMGMRFPHLMELAVSGRAKRCRKPVPVMEIVDILTVERYVSLEAAGQDAEIIMIVIMMKFVTLPALCAFQKTGLLKQE
jgi:hypothetical protein